MRSGALLGISMLAYAGTYAGPARAGDGAALALIGEGVQIYRCVQAGAVAAWQFKAPDAMLTDESGHRVGHHFAGPSWQAEDDSIVVGEPLVASPAPQAGAIPWLVLRAKSHAGDGLFAKVAYIVRSATEGGSAPTAGCDAAHVGAEARVGYRATYTFFPG